MATRSAWVLNLDADLELAVGPTYAARQSVLRAMRPFAERLAASLLSPGDVVVDPTSESSFEAARGLVGRAFCPTPTAIALLERAGATIAPHPSYDVLRAVNSRAFAASFGVALPGALFVRESETARAMLNRAPEVGDAWRAKRAFGMSGRGQRIVEPGNASAADLGFIDVCVAEGGVQIEPNVDIATEYGQHGMLSRDGALKLGSLVQQRCDGVGAWVSSQLADDEVVAAELADVARRVASALLARGYFGPFGIDAFTYRSGRGATELQPLSEINARYSMGFAVGLSPPPPE